MADKIINLVGPSGSGKTTIAKELEKEGYNIIKSYTTREPREPNEWGHTFMKLGKEWGNVTVDGKLVGFENFYPIEHEKYQNIDIDDMIAFKEIYGEYYFATKEQYQGKGTSIYTVDPDGAEQVKRNVKDAEVVTIFLMADEGIRARRLRDRAYESRGILCYIPMEKLEEFQKAKHDIRGEVEDRLMKDIEIFSTCKCNYAVDGNRTIEEVVANIKEIIEEEC